jgi:folate-binding protein YgfZ
MKARLPMPLDTDHRPTTYLTGDRVLRVQGSGARAWLNSLLTADLRQASPGTARYTLLLSPAGGIVSDAWAVECAADTLALVLPVGRAKQVHEVLERYLLNEDVSLAFDDAVRVLTVAGARGPELLLELGEAPPYACDRLGVGGYDVWIAAARLESILERLSDIIDAGAWSAWRIALGVPRAGVDFDEGTSPHEAGLEGRAVSFAKGCYLGQERVARQRRLGGLTQRLVQLEVHGSEPVPQGAIVRDPTGMEAGRVTSAAPISERGSIPALAYLPPHLAHPGTRVLFDGRPAQVRRIVGQAEASALQTG